ncbi:kelch-like protein 26 [Lineus longissimus]|uniref:kelch-like protein 26 n=1 Tax=Lineus longissimus TaxID=88925 RepID=UPI00315D09E0
MDHQQHILNSARAQHKMHVTEQLQTLFQDGTLCDVTLSAENYSVHAHKLVLAANSDYFRIMFSGNWSEKKDSNIVLHGLTACGLRAVIEFCYKGIITINPEDDVVDILSAIKHCQVVEAFRLFEEFLCTTINETNFSNLMEFSEIYLLQILRQKLIRFAARVFLPSVDQSLTDQLLTFDYDLFEAILQQYQLKSMTSGLGCVALFDVIVKWVQRDEKERQQYLNGLFSIVAEFLGESDDFDEFSDLPPFTPKKIQADIDEVREFCEMTLSQRRKVANAGGLYFLSTAKSSDTIAAHCVDVEAVKLVSPSHLLRNPLLRAGKAVLNNQIYVLGGHDRVTTDRCRRYDPCRDRWLSIRPLSAPRRGFPVVEFEGKLMVLGGMNDKNKLLSLVEVYDPYFNTWSKTSFSLPVCLHGHAAAVHLGRVYVSGGCITTYGLCSNQFFCLDPDEFTWTEKEETIGRRCGHTLIGHKGRLYQLGGSSTMEDGGFTGYATHLFPQIEYFDLAEDGPWTELEWTDSGPFAYPSFRGAYVLDDLLLMVLIVTPDDEGGEDEPKELRIIAYDPETCEINQLYEIAVECDGQAVTSFDQLLHLKIPRVVWRYYQMLDF